MKNSGTMDSSGGNKAHSRMNKLVAGTIPKKTVRYDLNIFTSVNIHDNIQDSIASGEECTLQICDNVCTVNGKKEQQEGTQKKIKSNKESVSNNQFVQCAPKVQRKKLKQSVSTDKTAKPRITRRYVESSYLSQNLSRESCQRQLKKLLKHNLSHIPLTPDEVNKLIAKYKLDGHFQVESGRYTSNGLNGEDTMKSTVSGNCNANDSYDYSYAQENNAQFNGTYTSSTGTTDVNANNSEYGYEDMFRVSGNTAANLHFIKRTLTSCQNREYVEDDSTYAMNIHNTQQRANMSNMTSLDNAVGGFHDAHNNNYTSLGAHDNNYTNLGADTSWNDTLYTSNEMQQSRNVNDTYILSDPIDSNTGCLSADTIAVANTNGAYKAMKNDFSGPGFVYDIPDLSTNPSAEQILGQNSAVPNLAMPLLTMSNADLMEMHNKSLLAWNIEQSLNNSLAKDVSVSRNGLCNENSSYTTRNEVTSLDNSVETPSTNVCTLMHNNPVCALENYISNNNSNNNISNDNNNNIGVNYDFSTTTWQCNNTGLFSNVGKRSDAAFLTVSDTLKTLLMEERNAAPYAINGIAQESTNVLVPAVNQCDDTFKNR